MPTKPRPVWFTTFPPPDLLPAAVAKKCADYDKLRARWKEATDRLSELNVSAFAAADEADAAARAAAARAGRDPSKLGSPARDKVAEEHEATRVRAESLTDALMVAGRELCDVFEQLAADDKFMGAAEARIASCLEGYRSALDAAEEARRAACAAAGLPAFVRSAVHAYAVADGNRLPVAYGPVIGEHPFDSVSRQRPASVESLRRHLDATELRTEWWLP